MQTTKKAIFKNIFAILLMIATGSAIIFAAFKTAYNNPFNQMFLLTLNFMRDKHIFAYRALKTPILYIPYILFTLPIKFIGDFIECKQMYRVKCLV